MNYKLAVHAVDIQDYDGFLSFLSIYARKGYKAIRIYRSFTIFQKTDSPPTQYHMRFLPEKNDCINMSSPPIKGLKNGIEIFPQAGPLSARESWNETVIKNYPTFVPYSIISLISRTIRFLILPVILLLTFLSFIMPIMQHSSSSVPLDSTSSVLYLILFSSIACIFAIDLFAYVINTIHLRGLKQSLLSGVLYSSSSSLRSFVFIKNCLIILKPIFFFLIFGVFFFYFLV